MWVVTAVGTLACATRSEAYRPFVSTDAAVADSGVAEVELGYLELAHDHGRNAYIAPHLVLNYGVASELEMVGEFSIEKPPDEDAGVAEPSVALKAVVEDGVLQEQPGLSFAVEAGALLPGSIAHETHVGFEGVGIASGEISPVTFHVNGGGGIDRDGSVIGLWGVIAELPVSRSLRVVGEVNGESTHGGRADDSCLLGVILQVPGSDVFVDLGVRKGFTDEAADWGLTTGVTFIFSPRRHV